MAVLAELYAAHPLWTWLALGALLLAVEIATGTGWLLWPSACAAATAFFTLIPGMAFFPAALTAFAVLTAASTLAARRYFPKRTQGEGPDINDAPARLIGRRGVAVHGFSGATGRVQVDGKEWPAEADAGAAPALGDAVQVVAVADGVLRVRSA